MPFVAPLMVLLLAPGEDLQATARRLEAEQAKAVLAKDVGYSERVYAPDFVSIGIKGQRNNRKTVLDFRRGLYKTFDVKSDVRKVIRVVPTQGGMLVTVDARSRGALTAPGTKQAHVFEIFGRSDEAWIKTAGGWRLKSTRIRALSTRLDGKPLD